MARGGSLLSSEWAVAIDPARRDGRIVAESSEEERGARRVASTTTQRPSTSTSATAWKSMGWRPGA